MQLGHGIPALSGFPLVSWGHKKAHQAMGGGSPSWTGGRGPTLVFLLLSSLSPGETLVSAGRARHAGANASPPPTLSAAVGRATCSSSYMLFSPSACLHCKPAGDTKTWQGRGAGRICTLPSLADLGVRGSAPGMLLWGPPHPICQEAMGSPG